MVSTSTRLLPARVSIIEHVRDDLRERAAVIALLRRAGSGWPMIACDVLERGSAVALLDEAVGDRDTLFPQPAQVHDLIEEAAARMHRWESAGLGVHTVIDQSYPSQLREIRELPPVVFTRGRLTDDARAVAVVGTRRASEHGLAIAAEVASALAHRGITVVSGLLMRPAALPPQVERLAGRSG
jgi:DNA processing protein